VNEYTCSKCGVAATVENGAVVRTCKCEAVITLNLTAVVVGESK
jgi:hypothetical protein